MVNPVLTILFDLFLIGSALLVTAGMTAEYLVSREPHIGSNHPSRKVTPAGQVGRREIVHRVPAQRRRAA